MPGSTNTLLIEGSFEELAEELAQYIDGIKKTQGEEGSNIQGEIAPLSEQGQKDEVLKKIVTASAILNAAPEKGRFTSSRCPVFGDF
jgi:translation initiation factor 3 subunit M